MAEISESDRRRQLQLTELESITPEQLRQKFVNAPIVSHQHAWEIALSMQFYEDMEYYSAKKDFWVVLFWVQVLSVVLMFYWSCKKNVD